MLTPSPLKEQSSSRLSSDTKESEVGFRSDEHKEDGGHEAQAESTEGEQHARLERQQTPVWLFAAQHEMLPREPFSNLETPGKMPTAHEQNTLDASGRLSFSPLSPHSLECTSTPRWLSAAQQKLELGHKDAVATMHINTGKGSLMRGEYSSPHTEPKAVAKAEAEVMAARAGLSGRPRSAVRRRQRWCGAVLVAALLLAEHYTVIIAHSRTQDLAECCSEADILVAAVDRPEMVRGDWIKPGAAVIDAVGRRRGIRRGQDGRRFHHPGAGRRWADDHRQPAAQHRHRGVPPERPPRSGALGAPPPPAFIKSY